VSAVVLDENKIVVVVIDIQKILVKETIGHVGFLVHGAGLGGYGNRRGGARRICVGFFIIKDPLVRTL
jgi:hypothetical protein